MVDDDRDVDEHAVVRDGGEVKGRMTAMDAMDHLTAYAVSGAPRFYEEKKQCSTTLMT